MNPANEQHEQHSVEAPHPVTLAGSLRPWKRGGPLVPGAIAVFTPAERDRWIPGAQFRTIHRRELVTLHVERVMPERRVPCRTTWRVGNPRSVRHAPSRVIPEAVVVRVLQTERCR